MAVLVLSVILVLVIWAICSFTEAALYAVSMPFVRQLRQTNPDAGKLLTDFKENIERPISAVLIVNTAVAAAGSSIVGAQASSVLGDSTLWLFSVFLTFSALVFSEIIPKILGVAYTRSVSPILAKPLRVTIAVLFPLIWLIEQIARWVKPQSPIAAAPEGEVKELAKISAEEGSIMPYEAELVRHVLNLDKVSAREIMTPVAVVQRVASNLTVGDVRGEAPHWRYSRIPLFDGDDPGIWTGYVMTRNVLAAQAEDRFETPLKDLTQPLFFVSAGTAGHRLLEAFLLRRTHLFGVTEPDGSVVGIVTLEDVLESIIGTEIIDESDIVADLQQLARLREKRK